MSDTRALFADEAPGLAQFLDGTFRRMVVRNARDIHDIVDDIIAQAKTSGGKGRCENASETKAVIDAIRALQGA